MLVRIRPSRAAKLGHRVSSKVEGRGIEMRMLSGEDDPRKDPAVRERFCYG
jgi:hypothetical protein